MFLTQISSYHTVLSSEHCICMTGKRRRAVTALAELSISHRSVITAAFSNLIYHCLSRSNHWWQKLSFPWTCSLCICESFEICICQGLFQPGDHPPLHLEPVLPSFGKWPVLRFSSFLYKIIMISIFLMNWTWPWPGLPCRGTLRARGLMIVLGCSSDSSNVDASLATHFWDPPFHCFFHPFVLFLFIFFQPVFWPLSNFLLGWACHQAGRWWALWSDSWETRQAGEQNVHFHHWSLQW